MLRAVALLTVLALLTGSVAFAEDPAGKAPQGKAKGKAEGEKDKKPEKKTQTGLQKILKQLKTLLAREKASPEHDKKLVKELEAIVKLFEREKEKPLTLEDLSEKDRKRLEDEVRKKMEEEGKGAAGGRDPSAEDWVSRRYREAVAKSLEGVKMTPEQRKQCEEIMGDFVKEFAPAQQRNDYKLSTDLKRDAERRLKKVVGAKKAKDIMNNVNRQLPNRRGWGGGGGR